MPPPPKITYTEAEFDALLYALSHTPYGGKRSLIEWFALDHDLSASTVEGRVRRYKRHRGLTGMLKPGDVPRSNRAAEIVGEEGFAFTSDEALVLRALAPPRYLTLAEIAERAGLPPHRAWHAVHRLLNYKRLMPSLSRICTVTRGERPTFKACYNL